MKTGKVAGPSSVVSKILKVVAGAGVHIITGLVNQIIEERVIPVEYELSIIAICYK